MLLKNLDPRLRRMIIQTIRRWFIMTPKYQEVKKKARRETPITKKDGTISKRKSVDYKCNKCREYYKANEIEIDHVNPVVAKWGSSSTMTLNQYIKQVDCPAYNLQVLCAKKPDSCHKIKTRKENKQRVSGKKYGK